MASKEVKKEVLQETQKEAPKKGRRLKRSVRKSLGAIFLASAIAVAAIPTDGLQASSPAKFTDWGTLKDNMPNVNGANNIPEVTPDDPIYTTGDGLFQFAYVQEGGDSVAVILGYTGGAITNNALEIPNKVNAYARLSDNQGTGGGYAAINKSGEFLYYAEYIMDERQVGSDTGDPKFEADGRTPLMEEYVKEIKYHACYWEDIDKWQWDPDNPKEERALEDFFYYKKNDVTTDPLPTSDSSEQWIKQIAVKYIGNQTLNAGTGDKKGTWTIGKPVTYNNRGDGVFAGEGNIVSLKVGELLSGIGDYAFYDCSGLNSITLGNGLNSIGVGAFANCINMRSINLNVNSSIGVIGDYAFYNCRALTTFTLPVSVRVLGNSAFEECVALADFNMQPEGLDGETQNILLSEIGTSVFKNCSSLKKLVFPSQFTNGTLGTTGDVGTPGVIPLSVFEGCTSLQCIEVTNGTITVAAADGVTFEKFKATVPATFYFRGPQEAKLHDTATAEGIAYSFHDPASDKDIYELTVVEDGKKAVYQVDENDNLVKCDMEEGMRTVTLPEQIGPNHIRIIGSTTFQDNCYLETITIPASINSISANAFQGCHQLRTVIFTNTNPATMPSIAAGAFRTQERVSPVHKDKCDDPSVEEEPKLYFVGEISSQSKTFQYAMSESEYINVGAQNRTYITYTNGWPMLLEVQRNPETHSNELVNYPTLADFAAKRYNPDDYPFIEQADTDTATKAVDKINKILNGESGVSLEDNERAVYNAVLDIVLCDGIESISEGLFVRLEDEEDRKDLEKKITAMSLKEVKEGEFANHKNLVSVTLSDATTVVGNYAFDNCDKLTYVSLPATVQTMGNAPFRGCDVLNDVNFNGSPYFVCDKSIIYELDSSAGKATKSKVVEYLNGKKSTYVTKEEMAGIKSIYPEAFYGTKVGIIDLSESVIEEVPEGAFAETEELVQIIFPKTIRRFMANAFLHSGIQYMTVPGQQHFFNPEAFGPLTGDEDKNNAKAIFDRLLITCEDGSGAEDFAITNNIEHSTMDPDITFKVTFLTEDGKFIKEVEVPSGGSAERDAPEAPPKEGYTFVGWDRDITKVTGNWEVRPRYERNGETRYTVLFLDEDGTEISSQRVLKGEDAIIPQNPTKAGYIFQGWVRILGDGVVSTDMFKNIQADLTVMARYRRAQEGEYDGTGGSGSPSPNPNTSGSPDPNTSGSPSPNPNTSGSPDPNTSGSPDPNASGSPGPGASGGSGTFYILTVQNGSGSGSYMEGAQPVIIANDPASGQEFDYWSVSPADVKIASTVLSASIITMPASDVTVTAHYKAKSGNSGGGNGDGSSTQRPNGNSGTVTNGGTTVVIDKNGLSNTGVVSATVNGSSDNFTIKISESATATEAALRALMAEYGDNLDNIKFFPMDISLYDSTGTTKITDTRGLSVSITLPLPDSLITYAGNNRVASVVNDKLERLSARFTTIQGVSCITFTAEHFSPYVIYVNTGDLSSGLVSDETPKTGDSIHPKWFLSIGLACLSFIFFMQKDTRKEKKVKVKVKA